MTQIGVESKEYLHLYYFLEKLRVSKGERKSEARLASERLNPTGFDLKKLSAQNHTTTSGRKTKVVWIGSR